MPVPPGWTIDIAASPRALRRRRFFADAAEVLGVILLFTLVTAVVFRQLLPHLGSALIGPPEDNMQDFWNVWYIAVGRQPGDFFHTDLLRFPEGASLHLHSFAYPKVIAIVLLTRLAGADLGTLLLLHNLSVLISFPLAGAGAFCLARHLTGSTAGALLGGFVFAFNPSHIAHAMHHSGVSSIEFIPPFALFYLLAVERKSVPSLALAIAFYALAALSSWYHLVYLACFILFHLVYTALRDRNLPRGWQIFCAAACPSAALAILAPLLVAMTVEALTLPAASARISNAYAADLLGFAAFPRFHALAHLADGLYSHFTGNAWEATAYLGLASVPLLVWACLNRRTAGTPSLAYALCGTAVFCTLACGSRLHVVGVDTVPLPGAALTWLPLASVMNAPSRAIVLAYLLLAVAVAEAVRAVSQDPRRLARVAAASLVTLVVADFMPARPLPMTPVACPAGLDIIRDDPEAGFGVLDLPPHGYVERNLYMLQQACHGRPIVLGNTSRRAGPTLGDRLDTWNVEAQRSQLLAAKVKYIVLRPQVAGAAASTPGPADASLRFEWRSEDAPRPHYDQAYSLVHDGPELAIFRVY
jgi:hypothetical protein